MSCTLCITTPDDLYRHYTEFVALMGSLGRELSTLEREALENAQNYIDEHSVEVTGDSNYGLPTDTEDAQ